VQAGVITGLLEAADRLADLADRSPLEREAVELDDRLVAQVEAPQSRLLVERE